MKFGVAGAGLSGAVVARELAEAGHRVTVHDRRPHIGGNCHTERDTDTGVMVHRYGPHIFHTSNQRVWDYVNQHAEMMPYRLTVRCTVGGSVYSLPINLHTINQVFGTSLGPRAARRWLERITEPNRDPANFEEAALASVGRRLYELFFEGYTTKQWGRSPRLIPASVFRRLPIRFSYDDSYFDHRWQAIPRDGYTAMIRSMLDHPNIRVLLDFPCRADAPYDHLIWTGPLDEFFGYRHGRLSYRTLRFEDHRDDGDAQGVALMTYGDVSVPWTRITEHKHLAPWETHDRTITSTEYSREAEPGDEPYYPTRLASDLPVLHAYLDDACEHAGVTFVGRLATYRYLDMDVTIAEALTAADTIREALAAGQPIPSITHQETTA